METVYRQSETFQTYSSDTDPKMDHNVLVKANFQITDIWGTLSYLSCSFSFSTMWISSSFNLLTLSGIFTGVWKLQHRYLNVFIYIMIYVPVNKDRYMGFALQGFKFNNIQVPHGFILNFSPGYQPVLFYIIRQHFWQGFKNFFFNVCNFITIQRLCFVSFI